jgi:prohibitin 2
MSARTIARLVGVALLAFAGLIVVATGTYVVQPGYRGVEVTMGSVSVAFKPEGFGLKLPFVTTIVPISIRQQTAQDTADCYSSDLQQVHIQLRVLFRIPEGSVVRLFRDFLGEPFASLIAPRVHEALKEVVASQSAEQIVKNREQIKAQSLDLARKKLGSILVIEDIVIENITLTKELEHAIEAKMVQEQEASKSKYLQQRAQIEADTVVIKAKGEAESIRVRGDALKENPAFVDLQVVDRWDGVTPLVIGKGDNVILPLDAMRAKKGTQDDARQR